MNKKKKLNEKEKEVENAIDKLINESDECVIVTSTKGNIQVTGIKNINYSHQVKGLLVGAIDTYNLRPVLQAINTSARNSAAQIANFVNQQNAPEAKVEKAPKEEK
jgi:hypothetical protein